MRRLAALAVVVMAATLPAATVAELAKKLASKDNEIRREAARELGELGVKAKPALKALLKALKDEDRFVRRFAAQAVGAIGPDVAKDAIKPLAALLDDDKQQVREAAITALAKMGPSAIPSLTAALGATDDVRETAVKALGEAGDAGVPGLVVALKDEKNVADLRRTALALVLAREKQSRTALGVMLEIAKKNQPGGQDGRSLRLEAMAALGKIATKADAEVVKALDDIAGDTASMDDGLKNAAKRAAEAVKKK